MGANEVTTDFSPAVNPLGEQLLGNKPETAEMEMTPDGVRESMFQATAKAWNRLFGDPNVGNNSLQNIILKSSDDGEAARRLTELKPLGVGIVRKVEGGGIDDREYVGASNLLTTEQVKQLLANMGDDFDTQVNQATSQGSFREFKIPLGHDVRLQVFVGNKTTDGTPKWEVDLSHTLFPTKPTEANQGNTLTDIVTRAVGDWKNRYQTSGEWELSPAEAKAYALHQAETAYMINALNLPEDATFVDVNRAIEGLWIATKIPIEKVGPDSVQQYLDSGKLPADLNILAYDRYSNPDDPSTNPKFTTMDQALFYVGEQVLKMKQSRAQKQGVEPYWHLIIEAEKAKRATGTRQ